MIPSDSSSRAIRRPAPSNAIPAASYSGWYQPAPMPSSNRPPDTRCRLAASCATMAGCRKSLESTRVPSRSRVVAAAAAARPLNGASCCPNAPAEKWSRSSSTSIPLSSTRRAKSSHARPCRTDSLTTPNRNLATARHGIAATVFRKCFNAVVKASKPDSAGQRKVTIKQVAEVAGVSIATVSRVVNGHADVSAETRQTVERVVREHGYQAAGRRPGMTPATGLIGVTTPWVLPGYFAEILSGVSEALYEHGLRTMLCPTRHSHERETSLLEQLVSGDADGAVLVLPEESAAELRALAEHGFPFVVVDPRTGVPDGIPVVCAAHSSGATQATRHLLSLGHRRIGVIGGPQGWVATQERLRGYHAALAGAGVLPDDSLVQHSIFRVDGGREAAARLLGLPDPPTAIFAFNDSMAIGVMQEAATRGLSVPGDCSVVGFDDTVEASIAVPALTT